MVKPTVLVATTRRWVPTARLVMALANAGFTVDAVCPTGHPVCNTGSARRIHPYHGLSPLNSFAHAIAQSRPDLIFPGDDLATWHLRDLFEREQRRGKKSSIIGELIERSLGPSESFPTLLSRSSFLEVAAAEGIRVPKTEVISSTTSLEKWVTNNGFPTVLKANGSSGGDGVRLVCTQEEAIQAFRALGAPPLLARAAKRTLVDRDNTLLWPSLLRRRFTVNAQAFVGGREATSSVACWKGSVLAALHFEVLNKKESSGPSTVLRLIENPEMHAAAEKIARRLNLSGLHGLDFMLEARTGNAYLIEINPRSTQVGHLPLGQGRDLPAALYAAVSGSTLQESPKVTEKDTIALFPQEWLRDSESSFLKSGYHDVPWEEPKLVDFCIRSSGKWRDWNSQQQRIQAFWDLARSPYKGASHEIGRKS